MFFTFNSSIIYIENMEVKSMYITRIISYVLVIVGALNWGLVGFFGFDLVGIIFGDMTILARIVYGLVGISALVLLLTNRDIFCEPNN